MRLWLDLVQPSQNIASFNRHVFPGAAALSLAGKHEQICECDDGFLHHGAKPRVANV
jgi:hypothetical protein